MVACSDSCSHCLFVLVGNGLARSACSDISPRPNHPSISPKTGGHTSPPLQQNHTGSSSPYSSPNHPAIAIRPPLSVSKPLKPHKSPPQNLHYEQNMTKMLGGCFNLSSSALTHMGRHAILQASKQAGEIRNCLYRQRISDKEWILMAFHSFVTNRCLMEAFAVWRNSSRSSTTTTVVFRCR